jgi:MurNAc alpha-1-phosphate uridylyltransferase
MWRDLEVSGQLEFVRAEGLCVPCDTPMDYLCANLLANGGESSIGEGARVDGKVERSVVWPGSVVRAGEHLVEAIRIGTDVTIRPFA